MVEATAPSDKTEWTSVILATVAGAAAAMQMGKAGAALPLIRAEFGATVSLLALYISLVSFVAASAGFGFGVLARRFGARRTAIAGLGCVGLAAMAAAFAQNAVLLLATRAVEAIGFALCTTALPAVVRHAAAPGRQALAMGVWAMWLPAGVAAAMGVSALFLDNLGWRGVFVICAAAPLLAGCALGLLVPRHESRPAGHRAHHGLRDVLRRDVLLTTGIFVCFAAANMIYMGFLTTILVDDFTMSPARATLLTMLAVLCLLPTNVFSGHWLNVGISRRTLFVSSFALMALSPIILMSGALPFELRMAGMFLFAVASGVPPGVVWASIPVLSRRNDDAPLLSGLFYQGAGIGQVIGPILAGGVVEGTNGWWATALTIVAFALLGMLLSLGLGPNGKPRR